MAVYSQTNANRTYFSGLSTDDKPTVTVQPGAIFIETDTNDKYIYTSSGTWVIYFDKTGLLDGSGNVINSSNGVLFTAAYIWQPSTLSYIHASADVDGNLNVTGGGGGGGGSVTQGTIPWVVSQNTVWQVSQYGTWTVSQSGTWTVNTKNSLTSNSPAVATVGLTSAQALASNANRKGLILTNTSSANISLGFGTSAVLGRGITLYTGGTFNMDEYSFTTAAINAIASVAGSTLGIQEWQ